MAVQGINVTRYGFSQPRGVSSRAPRRITPMQPRGYRPTSSTAVRRPAGTMSLAPFGQSTVNATGATQAQPDPTQKVAQTQQANTAAATGADASYEADPILAQIRAMGRADIGTARASAGAGRRKLLTEYGDETFARGVLKDAPADDPIFGAIRDNAFSVVKNVQRDREASTREAEDAFNKANLFYGGARIKGLGDLETSFLQRGNEAQGTVKGKLDEIEQTLILAEQESLQRELDYLMNNDYSGPYGGEEERTAGDSWPPRDDPAVDPALTAALIPGYTGFQPRTVSKARPLVAPRPRRRQIGHGY